MSNLVAVGPLQEGFSGSSGEVEEEVEEGFGSLGDIVGVVEGELRVRGWVEGEGM